MCVHPDYQYRGHGRELVKWGLDRAKEERIPSVVVAAEGKERFYQRCGYQETVGVMSQTELVDGFGRRDNPFRERGVGGGAVIWTLVKEDYEAEAKAANAGTGEKV